MICCQEICERTVEKPCLDPHIRNSACTLCDDINELSKDLTKADRKLKALVSKLINGRLAVQDGKIIKIHKCLLHIMLNGLMMEFNPLDILASAAALQTRDSETTGGTESNTQGSGSSEGGNSEQGTDNDEDSDSTAIANTDTQQIMGSMKKGKHSHVTPIGGFPKQMIDTDMEELMTERLNGKTNEKEDSCNVEDNVDKSVSVNNDNKDNSDTDSCMEEDMQEDLHYSTSDKVDISVTSESSKIVMRSLLTGETVKDDSDDVNVTDLDVCEDNVSVVGNNEKTNSADDDVCISEKIPTNNDNYMSEKCIESESLDKIPQSLMDDDFGHDKSNTTVLHDSALDSSQSASDGTSSCDTESINSLVVSDHCYATVPGKPSNLHCSYLRDDQESDSGIDGNSSSEEAEHRTRSISIDSNCLQCRFPEISGRSGQLLSQGSSDLERSPIGTSGFSLGLSVLSPTLSSSDSQCSDYHHTNNGVNMDIKHYKTGVDYDIDNSLSSTPSDNTPDHNLTKVGKFRIGKFASFTNIDTDQEKIYGRDAFSPVYSLPSSANALPSSPGIPSLLQSPCGDWDRSDAGSEVLDDLESILAPDTPKELLMVLQGIKSPNSRMVSPPLPQVQSSVVHHDHDYCFRSGTLPPSPVITTKKSEKRKYMTAARSRGTPASLRESKKSKALKIKNMKKGQLSETIEKVKHSLASTPVIECDFKKPEQPVNSLLYDKLNPANRQKRVKSLEIKEEPEDEGEADPGSKLKITGKFQNDFVYFLNKTSRNRRRTSVETSLPLPENKKTVQPAKPIDIIVPHLTDDDLEVLKNKGRAGLARLEKFSSNPHLLDRFSATLQTKGVTSSDPGFRIKTERNNGVESSDDDKIINTILSMENDNLGSPVPVETHNEDMDFFSGEETINLMGENMTLTKDQVDLLLNAVKHVAPPEVFNANDKLDMISPDCDHSSTCSTEILDPNTTDIANPDWTVNNIKTEKIDEDTESTYSSSDVGQSSCVSDIKEDSQDSFELQSDLALRDDVVDQSKVKTEVQIKTEIEGSKGIVKKEEELYSMNNLVNKVDDSLLMNGGLVDKDVNFVKQPLIGTRDGHGLEHSTIKSEEVDNPVNIDSVLVDNKDINRSVTQENVDSTLDKLINKSVSDSTVINNNNIVSCSIDNQVINNKPLIIDSDLPNLDITKPDKSLLDSELNAFPHPLGSSLSDLNLPLEKSFDLLGNEFRLDKTDDLFPEANVETPSMPEPRESDYNDTPWVVTVTVFWNDLPAIMINNRPYIRLVDIHKQILPAKDTGILKKRCQLLSIHVLNCTEMQRYFLVQYGRGYNSKSTLIVGKVDACQLVGYYAQPQPRLPRSDDVLSLSRIQHMAMIRKQSRFNKRKRSKVTSRNTSPERKEGVKNGSTQPAVPSSPKPRKQPPQPPVIQPELTKRLRHKKINFLEMLKGDSQDKTETEESNDKKVTTLTEKANNKKKSETSNNKKLNNRANSTNKKKEVEIEVTTCELSSEEEASDTETEEEFDDEVTESECEEELTESEEETLEDEVDSETNSKKLLKSENSKQSPKKSPSNKRSPSTDKKSPNVKTGLKKLGPLRVNVKGLLNFPKSVNKSAINNCKNGGKGLEVVHTPLEFRDGIIPISQSGKIYLDLYKKKSSLCVKCADCEKLLSISSFLQHQHYPEESKTLTTVLDTQTLSLKTSDSSRNIKQLWEELQKRYEKFEGCRFLKPVVKALAGSKSTDIQEDISSFKSVIVRKNYPHNYTDIPVPMDTNCNLDYERDIKMVQEDLPQTILDNSEPEVEKSENGVHPPESLHCHTETFESDKEELSANNVVNNEYSHKLIDNQDESKKLSDNLPVKTHLNKQTLPKVNSSQTEVQNSKKPVLQRLQPVQTKIDSGVRSSSRKRKSRQYFSFEDYSFSNKKTKMDENSESK